MEEILIVILQGIFELAFQVFSSGLLDLFTWREHEQKRSASERSTVGILVFAAGCGLGWLSLWLMPYTLIQWGWMRMGNLIIGPAISAWVSWRIATWRQQRNSSVEPRSHALVAGLACLGLVLVRFIWGTRG